MPPIHKPFHQKYRPLNLDELIGQEVISITLKQALISNKIATAYLFNGPRGTGKTSSARIFAKSLNCLSYNQATITPCENCSLCKQINEGNALDIIEIDAASNTGVENIREIIERARFSPTQARWKVYVIDECHMLSTAASNALLKTIEEPPNQVVFILATTNPERVIDTIQSRCQRFDFKRIGTENIFHHLLKIANKESIKFEDQALKLIAKRSNGGMRDAQSLLDQLSIHPNGITVKNVQKLIGEVSEIELIQLIDSLIKNNPESLLISSHNLYNKGNEPTEILVGLMNITRDLLLIEISNEYSEIFYTSQEFQNELEKISKRINKSTIISWHNNLKNIEYQIKTSDHPRLWLDIHLTSLLKINGSIKNQTDNKNKIETNNQIDNKDNIETNNQIDNKNKIDTNNQTDNKNKIETNNQIEDDNQSIKLKEKWALILSKLELPSTRMLLSQQAELASIESNLVEIKLSPNWENMIKSRKVIIENAVKKVFGDEISIQFTSKTINKTDINLPNEPQLDSKLNNQHIQKESPILKNNTQTDKVEKFNNNSKNLANFFNGEIIDIDD